MFRRCVTAISIVGFTMLAALPVAATVDPCGSGASPSTCLASLPTESQIAAAIATAHSVKTLGVTSPTLAYLANASTGPRSFFMPAGRCNQVAQMADAPPPSVKDCTFGQATAPSNRTIFLTGDSRAVMWTTTLARLATINQMRLVVMAKPGCVAQTGSLTYMNVPGRPGPWAACDRFRTAVMSTVSTLQPSLIIVASNPSASLADGRTTTTRSQLGHDNALSYLSELRNRAPNAALAAFVSFPLVTTTSGGANPVACLSAHKANISFCDVRPRAGAGDDAVGTATTQAASEAGFTIVNQRSWLCDSTCPAVINGMIPYDREGMHVNNTYAASLMGVVWRKLAAVPQSPLSI
ncbi:MAG: hypothetical protein KJS64_04820 [Acidobacteria bacterium]|nr:hypothetical protein [Acidobacteriota bacterium]